MITTAVLIWLFLALVVLLIAVLTAKKWQSHVTVAQTVATILLLWALASSWMFFYYFFVYLSVPAWVIATAILGYLWVKNVKTTHLKVNTLLSMSCLAIYVLMIISFDL